MGTFKSLRSVLDEDSNVIDNPWDPALKWFLNLPVKKTILDHLKERDRLRRYVDPSDTGLRQIAADSGLTLIGFESTERDIYGAYMHEIHELYDEARELSARFGREFTVNIEDILLGTLISQRAVSGADEEERDEDDDARKLQWQRKNLDGFVEVRTRGMREGLKRAYQRFYLVFKKTAQRRRRAANPVSFVIGQYTGHPSESASIDLGNADVFLDYALNGGFFGLPEAEVTARLGNIRVDRARNVLARNIDPANLPRDTWAIYTHLPAVAVTGSDLPVKALLFSGIGQNLLDPNNRRKRFFSTHIVEWMGRLQGPDGRFYFSRSVLESLEPEDFPIFPTGDLTPEAVREFFELLTQPGKEPIALPVTLEQWTESHLSIRDVLTRLAADVPAARSELRQLAAQTNAEDLKNALNETSRISRGPELQSAGFEWAGNAGLRDQIVTDTARAAAQILGFRGVSSPEVSKSAGKAFDYFFEFKSARDSVELVRRLAHELPDQAKLIVFVSKQETSARRVEIYGQLHKELSDEWRLAGNSKVLLARFDREDWNLDSLIDVRRKHYDITRGDILWIDRANLKPGIVARENEEAVYLGAARLTGNYIVVAGGNPSGVKREKRLDLLDILAAVRLFQKSA